jgi:hypothetical protein
MGAVPVPGAGAVQEMLVCIKFPHLACVIHAACVL